MRALWVVHYPNFGGPHNEALRLRAALERRGWDIAVASSDEPGTAAARLRAGGVETMEVPLVRLRASLDPRRLLRYLRGCRATVRALVEAIDRTGADVVIVSGIINPHAAFAARKRGAGIVWQIVDSRTPALLRRVAMVLVRRFADAVLFDGEALIDLHGGLERLRVPSYVYYPPVDTTCFVPSAERRARIRKDLGIPDDAPLVGTVSVFSPMKGLEIFLDACLLIAGKRPDARFVIVGAEPASHRAYGDALRRRAQELGLPYPVVFAGERADVENWYAAFDLHVITSLPRSEGTTTTALEAQACGVPVVATRVAALPEVVEDGVTGCLVEPLRPDRVAAAVLTLLEDDAARVRMGAAARGAAVTRFDVEAGADVYVRAFESAVERARSRESARRRLDRAGRETRTHKR